MRKASEPNRYAEKDSPRILGMGSYRRSEHWRRGKNGEFHRVRAHNVERESSTWESPPRIASPRISQTFDPIRPRNELSYGVRPENRPAYWWDIPKVRNARCPVCGADVYFYANEYGSRVYFDELQPPWPKHPCTDRRLMTRRGIAYSSPGASPPIPGSTPSFDQSKSRSFTLTTTVRASRNRVWTAWTNPRDLGRWFFPGSSSLAQKSISIDLRVGGTFRYTIVDDFTGQRFPAVGEFLHIDRGQRFILSWGPRGIDADEAAQISVTLVERGNWTDVSFTFRSVSKSAHGRLRREWEEVLENLSQYLRRNIAATKTLPSRSMRTLNQHEVSPSIQLTCTIDAPPRRVWAAWTVPSYMAQWMHPEHSSSPEQLIDVDLRRGGYYRYTVVETATGKQFPAGGKYRQIVPWNRLVFSWEVPGRDDSNPPLITLDLSKSPGRRTELSLKLEAKIIDEDADMLLDYWSSVLENLCSYCRASSMFPLRGLLGRFSRQIASNGQ
ncbi:SRPBCC domain-containing protein [Arthrobacter rhombi]|uniref:SRPBCC domain-containing protein n=1 Tax=Arthrobacter rhombi TaxID=71253 RepID=UPI003FD3B73A